MEPLAEPVRPPEQRPRRRAAPADARRSLRSLPPARAARDEAETPPLPTAENDEESLAGDAGTTLLLTVSAAMLLIVALAWLVGAVDHWWILIPVVTAALALAVLVLAVVMRLLDDD